MAEYEVESWQRSTGSGMKIYLHGNCQVYVIANILKDVYPEWDIQYFEVHAEPILQRSDDYKNIVRTADVIVSQPIHENYRGVDELALSWIRGAAKAGCQLVVIPATHFGGHHPESASLGALGSLCNNSLAAHLVMAGVDANAIVATMMSPDIFSDEVIQTEIDMQIQEMYWREKHDKNDVSIGDILENYASWMQLYHIVNHATRPIYVHIINRVLRHLGAHRCIPMDGVDLQPVPHLPMCPAIARFCAGRQVSRPDWAPEIDTRVLMPGYDPMEMPNYLEKMIEQLQQHSRAAIADAIRADWRSSSFLKRLAAAGAAIPGIDIWNEA